MGIFFNRVLTQVEVMKKLSKEMPSHEYSAMTSQIVELAKLDEDKDCGHLLNFVV